MSTTHAWMQVPMELLLERLDQLNADVMRAMKITNGDKIERLAVHDAGDVMIPPAVCSRWWPT